ncbi:hypothetical protein [Novipirellula rosea]|uniref:TubC N-terminal docking domain-containing protein n=1 Tax=Novipirellula rosea TaxID=1031540 RepID=A0ABP8MW57_9BACT
MSAALLLDELAARDVVVTLSGESLEIDAPRNSLSNDDINALQQSKRDIIRKLRVANGLSADDSVAKWFECDEVDIELVPVCKRCSQYCDVQLMDDSWRCSYCDPGVEAIRRRTSELLQRKSRILDSLGTKECGQIEANLIGGHGPLI